MSLNVNNSNHLFVANLESVTLEDLFKSKLEILLKDKTLPPPKNLHRICVQAVEKKLIEICLKRNRFNQIRTAQMLGLNRNTLKKKLDAYDVCVKKLKAENLQSSRYAKAMETQ